MLLQVIDLAQLCDVSPDTIRHYSRIGLLQPSRNPVNGYRQFSINDIKRLNFIKKAKNLGFSLNEIKRILTEYQQGNSPCPIARDLITHRIKANQIRLEQLINLQMRMEQALADWAHIPDGIPCEESICLLIESFDHNQELTTSAKEKMAHN